MRKIIIFLIALAVLLAGFSFIAAGSAIDQQSGAPVEEEETTGYFSCCCGIGGIMAILLGVALVVMVSTRYHVAKRMK